MNAQNQLGQQYTQNLAKSVQATKQQLAIQGIQAGAQKVAAVFNPNKNEAYAIPLSRLVVMWQARYSDEWVAVYMIEDDFYRDAHDRLRKADKFEVCDNWVRLKEDA
jgi:hypothetical protein